MQKHPLTAHFGQESINIWINNCRQHTDPEANLGKDSCISTQKSEAVSLAFEFVILADAGARVGMAGEAVRADAEA